jgi:hypothetical protein
MNYLVFECPCAMSSELNGQFKKYPIRVIITVPMF